MTASLYTTIAVLFVDVVASKTWEIERRLIRERFLRDSRRMSYKSLNDRRRRIALVPFLSATNHIHGVLATFVIRKAIKNIVIKPGSLTQWKECLDLKGSWTEVQFEQMLRVAHFVSMLIGTLGMSGQSIYWISDEDEIMANPARHADVSRIMSGLANLYVKFHPSELGLGTTSIDPGDRIEEDLSAITDLAAGAIADIVTELSKMSGYGISQHLIPINIVEKTKHIGNWYSDDSRHLKKIIMVFDESDR